jgi:MerR family mercuric resistance operon transcriptional regulator
MTIGALAKRAGCNVETIRYYERIGLLPKPARGPGGYRRFGIEHTRRLAFVRRARELGFTLEQVRALLALAEHPDQACAEARALAADHLVQVRTKIANLQAMEDALANMVAGCAEPPAAGCPLIEALDRPPA